MRVLSDKDYRQLGVLLSFAVNHDGFLADGFAKEGFVY